MNQIENVETATPAEIDGRLGACQAQAARLEGQKKRFSDLLDRYESADDHEKTYSWFSEDKIDAAREALAAAAEEGQALVSEVMVLTNEFTRRGGWERYYLVTNTGGHVHWTTGCGTCFPTTQFSWLTQYSGMARSEFVEFAGSKACTVCFPDAPVDVLRRKSQIEDPEAKERREEREAKAAAKKAAEVTAVVLVSTRGARVMKEVTWKTLRGLQNDTSALARTLLGGDWAMMNGVDYSEHHDAPEVGIESLKNMLATLSSHGVDTAALIEKAKKRVAKERVAAEKMHAEIVAGPNPQNIQWGPFTPSPVLWDGTLTP